MRGKSALCPLLLPGRHAGLGNAFLEALSAETLSYRVGMSVLTPVKAVPASAQAKGSMYQGA